MEVFEGPHAVGRRRGARRHFREQGRHFAWHWVRNITLSGGSFIYNILTLVRVGKWSFGVLAALTLIDFDLSQAGWRTSWL